jgi:hypothetical protein
VCSQTLGASSGIGAAELTAMFDQQKLLIIGAFRTLSDLAQEECRMSRVRRRPRTRTQPTRFRSFAAVEAVRAEREANLSRFRHIVSAVDAAPRWARPESHSCRRGSSANFCGSTTRRIWRRWRTTNMSISWSALWISCTPTPTRCGDTLLRELTAQSDVFFFFFFWSRQAAQNFVEMQSTLAATKTSFMNVVGSLMTHVSDYKSRVANEHANAGFRDEISAILRLHAQHLFAEMVTRDATVANAAVAIANAFEAEKNAPPLVASTVRHSSRTKSTSSVTTTTDVTTTTTTATAAAAAAATSSSTAHSARAESDDGDRDDDEVDWSGDDEEDSLGAEVKRISDHLLRKVKRRRDEIEKRAQKVVPANSFEAKLALYPDDEVGNNQVHHARSKLPSRATAILKQWLFENWYHPYPTDAQKRRLGEDTGLSVPKINNWFTNARRRILPKKQRGATRAFDAVAPDADDTATAGGLDRGSTALLFASVGLPVPPFDVHLPLGISSSLLNLPQQQQQQQQQQQ